MSGRPALIRQREVKQALFCCDALCLLLTLCGHGQFKIFAAQIDRCTPFRWSQIPAVIIDAVGVVLSLGEGNATTRFHKRNC
jgi:hypothetical protein